MFWNKKIKRVDLNLRTPRKRRSFFEKKRENPDNPLISRAIFRIIFLFFVASATYILFFSQFLEVKKVYLEGISELNYDEIQQKIGGILEEKYFRLIPKDNFIIFPEKEIKSALTGNFKKINAVEIEKIFPDSAKIKITERKALLIWCSGDSCYIIDDNGYAYTEADFESEDVKQNNLVRLTDISAEPVTAGKNVLDKEYMQFIINLGSEIEKETGIKVLGEYRTQSRVAEEVRVRTEGGLEIYFSTSLPMGESIQTLKTFLDKEMNADEMGKLEYIDFRAENKAYYKFKNEEQTQDGTDSAQTNADNAQNKTEDKKDTKNKKK